MRKDITKNIHESRKATRKLKPNLCCRFDHEPMKFPLHELSAHGFSFFCSKTNCFFRKGAGFERISIMDTEKKEIMTASGTVVHTSEYDFNKMRIGVVFTKAQHHRQIDGQIRVFRHIPRIPLYVELRIKGNPLILKGQVIDFTALTARISLDSSDTSHGLKENEELSLKIFREAYIFYKGKVQVIQTRYESSEIIIEIIKTPLDVVKIERLLNAIENSHQLSETNYSLDRYQQVNNQFKSLISDWRMYFHQIKCLLDVEDDKGTFQSEEEQEIFLKIIEKTIFPTLNHFILCLNHIAGPVDEKNKSPYLEYFRENLDIYFRTSAVVAAAIEKPFGYAGDYELIRMFFRNPYVGDSLFAKLMNKFILSFDAVLAHQERIEFLSKTIWSAYKKTKGKFSVMTMGSGPAEELLNLVKKHRLNKTFHATLVDFDAFSLASFSEQMQYIRRTNFESELINIDIIGLLRRQNSHPVKKKYNIVYAAGTLGYFSDTVSKRLVLYMIEQVKPGGCLIITNPHKRNKSSQIMEFAGRWKVNHREEKDLESFVPSEYRRKFFYDTKKTNMFLKIYIPRKQ